MSQMIQRHSRVTLHRSTHPQGKRDLITWSHKLYRENHENLESGIDSRRKKLSWGEGPRRYISRRCTITVTIHNCHDATYHILKKGTAEYKLSKSQEKIKWTPTHGRAKAGRPARTYIQQLCEDTGCCPEDLPEAMNDREKWRERVRDIRTTSTTWWWWWSNV